MTEKLHQQAQRGVEASQLLDNPAFRAGLDRMKSEVVAQWKACPVRDQEGQLLLLQLAKMTDMFEGVLISMVEGGKFAQHQLKLDAIRNESAARKALRRAGVR